MNGLPGGKVSQDGFSRYRDMHGSVRQILNGEMPGQARSADEGMET